MITIMLNGKGRFSNFTEYLTKEWRQEYYEILVPKIRYAIEHHINKKSKKYIERINFFLVSASQNKYSVLIPFSNENLS